MLSCDLTSLNANAKLNVSSIILNVRGKCGLSVNIDNIVLAKKIDRLSSRGSPMYDNVENPAILIIPILLILLSILVSIVKILTIIEHKTPCGRSRYNYQCNVENFKY